MDHILYPTFYGRTNDDRTKISKSLVDLTKWAKEEGASLLTVRRYEPCGAIAIKVLFAYEFVGGRPVRVI